MSSRSDSFHGWNGCPAASAGRWSIDWSRPGHRLRSSTSLPDASPIERSVSNRTGPGGVVAGASSAASGADMVGGGGGAWAASRVPAGTRLSPALPARVKTTGARAAWAGMSPTPSRSSRASWCLSGAWLSRCAVAARNGRRPGRGPRPRRSRPGATRGRTPCGGRAASRRRRRRPSARPAGRRAWSPGCPLVEVERVDEVVQRVGRPDPVVDLDDEAVALLLVGGHVDVEDIDARLPVDDRVVDLRADPRHRRRVDRLEEEGVEAGAEVRAHHALSRVGAEDDPQRLVDVLLVGGHRRGAVGLDPRRERPADAEEGLGVGTGWLRGHRCQPPICTVRSPATIGAPQPAVSPVLAAPFPPIRTVALPLTIVLGGWGPAVGGRPQVCESPNTAAGWPPMRTVGTPGPVTAPLCPV